MYLCMFVTNARGMFQLYLMVRKMYAVAMFCYTCDAFYKLQERREPRCGRGKHRRGSKKIEKKKNYTE